MDKFAGVGLGNVIVIWLVCCILSLIAKTLVLKYDLPDSIQATVTAAA